MQQHTVLFASSGSLSSSKQRWIEPMLRAWPGDAKPDFQSVSLAELLEKLANTAGGPDAVLAVLGPEETPRVVDAIQEAILAANLGGVVLAPDPAPYRTFQRQGVLFDRLDADCSAIASMLFATCERQEAVNVLAREVALSRRCQGGIQDEMDKIHEELHLAAAIQREFTNAPLPALPGLDIGVVFRPLSFVSGDVYWVRALDDRHVALLVADAVGHGVPAALLTMVLTSSLVTHETREGRLQVLSPSDVLHRLNRRLCESCLTGGRFVTGIYAVIDSFTREVTLAGAGHPHPVVLGPRGLLRTVSTDGPLLGVFGEADFDQVRFTLAEGESLIIYTDGLEAALPRNQTPRTSDPCVQRLAALRQDVNAPRASRLVQELHALLDSVETSLHHADDVTAVCITAAAAANQVSPGRAAA